MATRAQTPNALSEIEKRQVVKWFAEFYTPQQVSDLVTENFGKTRGRDDIQKYAATKKWQPLFQEHRAKFLSDLSTIPYANKAVRLHRLNRLIDRLFTKAEVNNKSWLFVVDRLLTALNQMAKETDGHVITIKQVQETVVYLGELVNKHVDDEDTRRAIAAELRGSVSRN